MWCVLSLWEHCFAGGAATLVVVSAYQIEAARQIPDGQGEMIVGASCIGSVVWGDDLSADADNLCTGKGEVGRSY